MSKKEKNNQPAASNHFFEGQRNERKTDRYLDIAKSKDNWRMMAFLMAFLIFFLLGAYIYKSQQMNIQPVVYHQNEAGQFVLMGEAKPVNINDRQQIQGHVYKVVDQLRTVYTHNDVMARRLDEIFQHFISADVSNYLNTYYQISENDPRVLISQGMSRNIQIQGIVPTEGGNRKWKVRWIETTITATNTIKRQAWEAFLTIDFESVSNQQQALVNPLGMIVTDLSWGPISQSQNN